MNCNANFHEVTTPRRNCGFKCEMKLLLEGSDGTGAERRPFEVTRGSPRAMKNQHLAE